MSWIILALLSYVKAEGLSKSESIDERATVSTCIIVIVLLVILSKAVDLALNVLAKHRYHISGSISNMFIGIVFGLLLEAFRLNKFTATLGDIYQSLFMILLLPIILFNSAISMNKIYFFKNFRAIILYAIVGTLISVAIMASCTILSSKLNLGFSLPLRSCIVFAVLMAGTDVVGGCRKGKVRNKNLSSLVGGEALLNDAVSLAFFAGVAGQAEGFWGIVGEISERFIWAISGSVIVGLLMGILCSVIVRRISAQTSERERVFEKLNELRKKDPNFKELDTINNLSGTQLTTSDLAAAERAYEISRTDQLKLNTIHEEQEEEEPGDRIGSTHRIIDSQMRENGNLPPEFAGEYQDAKHALNGFRNQELLIAFLLPLLCYLLSEVI